MYILAIGGHTEFNFLDDVAYFITNGILGIYQKPDYEWLLALGGGNPAQWCKT